MRHLLKILLLGTILVAKGVCAQGVSVTTYSGWTLPKGVTMGESTSLGTQLISNGTPIGVIKEAGPWPLGINQAAEVHLYQSAIDAGYGFKGDGGWWGGVDITTPGSTSTPVVNTGSVSPSVQSVANPVSATPTTNTATLGNPAASNLGSGTSGGVAGNIGAGNIGAGNSIPSNYTGPAMYQGQEVMYVNGKPEYYMNGETITPGSMGNTGAGSPAGGPPTPGASPTSGLSDVSPASDVSPTIEAGETTGAYQYARTEANGAEIQAPSDISPASDVSPTPGADNVPTQGYSADDAAMMRGETPEDINAAETAMHNEDFSASEGGEGEKLVNETTKETEKKATEETAAKKAEDEVPRKKIIANNVGQYALLIMEALKAKETEDAIKEVTVKGAEPMQQTQGGDCTGAALTAADLNTPMSATTIADSATAMKALLQMGKIDLSLLSTDIVKPEQTEVEGAIEASAGKSGADVDAHAPPTSTTTDENDLTTQEEREIKRRRSLLLGEWATAATQIGEGSNAISSAFYDRAAGFAAAANSAYGSLGGITTITDTDRFVLFELTRGAALSAIGLGLQGAVNLNNLSESETKFPPEEDPTAVTAGAGQ